MACGPLGGERRDQLLLVRRARGMSTPYAGLSLGNGTGQAMNLGWRLSLGSNAAFGIEGARRRGADDNAPDHRLMLHASLGWQSPMGRRPAKRDALGPNDSTPSMVARFVTVHLCGGGEDKVSIYPVDCMREPGLRQAARSMTRGPLQASARRAAA